MALSILKPVGITRLSLGATMVLLTLYTAKSLQQFQPEELRRYGIRSMMFLGDIGYQTSTSRMGSLMSAIGTYASSRKLRRTKFI